MEETVPIKQQGMSTRRPIRILLLGKTGYDKSITANSILQKQVFGTDAMSHLSLPRTETGSVFGRSISVTDTPGIMDSHNVRATKKALNDFLTTWGPGFDAVVIVMRYPVRMTPEELENIHIITDLIGQSGIKKYGVLLFTNGVAFTRSGQPTFEDYLASEVDASAYLSRNQESLGQLIKNVEKRCIAFDNDTEDETRMNEQLGNFLNVVDRLKSRNRDDVYRKQNFLNQRTLVILGVALLGVFIVIIIAVLVTQV